MNYESEYYKVTCIEGMDPASLEYDIEEVYDDSDSLNILLNDYRNNRKLILNFEGPIFYRKADERYYLKRWGQIRSENRKANFFIVENSSLLDWLEGESEGLFKACHPEAIHYAVLTQSSCLDVIAEGQVTIRVADEK